MAEKKEILDKNTKEIIFYRIDPIYMRFYTEDSLEKDLKEVTQNPLSDLDAINQRLDTIEELVKDNSLRKKLSCINALSYGRSHNEFYNAVNGFIIEKHEFEGYNTDFKENSAKNLVIKIKSMGRLGKKLFKDFGEAQLKTKTLKDIARNYLDVIQDNSEDSITKFFEYIKEINKKILKLEKRKKEKKKPKDKKEDNEEIKIKYSELEPLIDCEKLESFKKRLYSLKSYFKYAPMYLRLANIALKNKYTRPIVVPREENCLIIEKGKFDILYDSPSEVIPNDTYLDKDVRAEVLEGPNNSGKTIDMKKSLYIAILALSGNFVPAKYAKVSVRDKIIMREKGTGNAISAFQQDCVSINMATPPEDEYWLIGMDETVTSTEKKGGGALFYGNIKSILDQEKSLLINPSHYLGMHNAFDDDSRVRFNHFPFRKRYSGENGKVEVTFSYKKKEGPLPEILYSYAIAVAYSMGFDKEMLQYAAQRIKNKIKQKRI